MKEENKIPIKTMQARLQARMHYKHPEQAFNILLICYGHFKKRSINWAAFVQKKGWMSLYLAHEFAKYVGYPIDKN